MVKRVEKSPSGRYEANVHERRLRHAWNGGGSSCGTIKRSGCVSWRGLDAGGRDERGEQNGNVDELEGLEISVASQMPILRAAASASLKSDCAELRASRESGSLQRFVSASIEYGTVGTLVGQ
jgi:hypothetical protein